MRQKMTNLGGVETARQPLRLHASLPFVDPEHRTEHEQQLYDFTISRFHFLFTFPLATRPFNMVELTSLSKSREPSFSGKRDIRSSIDRYMGEINVPLVPSLDISFPFLLS